MSANNGVLNPLEKRVEKAVYDEAAGFVTGNATGLHVEQLIFAHWAVGGAMGAADFVIQDFQAWHGVRVGIIAQDEIPYFLIGVCALGAWFNFYEACKNRA